MSNQVDFLPFAIGNGANVSSQSDYAALAAMLTGFQSGPAKSAQVNKALRQGTVMAAVLANFIANNANVNVLDNGDTATLLINLVAALKAANASAGFLNKANNLSDLASVPIALANLGLLTNGNVGRLINVVTFNASGTYIPTPGMKFALVKGIGAGGAGGGAPVTLTGNVGLGAGGHAGAYGEGLFTAAQIGLSQAVTIGAGGTGTTGGGGNGGSTSLGSLITFGGGSGANSSGNSAPPLNAGNGNALAVCTGANVISGFGAASTIGQITSTAVGYSGAGANSAYGAGGGATNMTGPGASASGFGSGGGGACAMSANATARVGGNGALGFLTIYEYA